MLRLFSYQNVSRPVTETDSGNGKQWKEILTVFFALVLSILLIKERLYGK